MVAVDHFVFYIRTTQLPSGHTNALAESFNAALKVERVNRTGYPTREHARKDVARYIELHYNTKRLHSALLPNPTGSLRRLLDQRRAHNTNKIYPENGRQPKVPVHIQSNTPAL
jgi:Integrase core domain